VTCLVGQIDGEMSGGLLCVPFGIQLQPPLGSLVILVPEQSNIITVPVLRIRSLQVLDLLDPDPKLFVRIRIGILPGFHQQAKIVRKT
jgi:hypothetical protein